MRIWPGSPYPLGATFDGAGVNFAIFSEHATTVELCLYPAVELLPIHFFLDDRHLTDQGRVNY